MGKIHYKSPFSIAMLVYQRVKFMFETTEIAGHVLKKKSPIPKIAVQVPFMVTNRMVKAPVICECWLTKSPIKKKTTIFPECVARVPVSLWGSGGWGCVRSTLPNRSQPFATVRNRPQPFARSPYGRAYGKFCRRGHFWRFQTRRCFISRGRRGTLWHSDVFCNVLKIVLRGRRNTFVTFFEDVLQFSWQAQHFGRVHRHFSWQAQHFRRVLLRVFCKSHWQGCVKWRQGANSLADVAFSDMCWKLTEASHETLILGLQIFRF